MRHAMPVALAFSVCSGMLPTHFAVAETLPPLGAVDPRVRVVAYNPDDVVKLQGYVGYQIHMQWADGEQFVSLGSGDAAAFDIGVERNHFFIKPKQERVGTNITVLTTRRAYHFEYLVSKVPPAGIAPKNMVFSIRFTYPEEQARAAAAALERETADQRLAAATPSRTHNRNYWYCGSASLRPAQAYDDGVHTRLRFAPRAEFPAIFVKNDDHSESLLNFNVEDDEVVVHRVASRLILRRGQLVGCVENRAFDGGGERLKSHTTVPGVERTTREVAP
jgi:type IV secretion system protein VirB9